MRYPLECEVEIKMGLHADAKSKIFRRLCRASAKRIYVVIGENDRHPETYDIETGRFIAKLETRLAIPSRNLLVVYSMMGGVLFDYRRRQS